MSSHLNMSANTEIIKNDITSTDTSNAETNENKELAEAESQSTNSLNKVENSVVEKYDDEINIENSDSENLEKMILSTGIRVGTPVKTKSMSRYIVRANPEGLYI